MRGYCVELGIEAPAGTGAPEPAHGSALVRRLSPPLSGAGPEEPATWLEALTAVLGRIRDDLQGLPLAVVGLESMTDAALAEGSRAAFHEQGLEVAAVACLTRKTAPQGFRGLWGHPSDQPGPGAVVRWLTEEFWPWFSNGSTRPAG